MEIDITSQVSAVIDQIFSLNTVLVMLGVGVIIWAIRQILPDTIEGTKVWRTILRVAPVGLGAAVALIPGLRPIQDNLAQSAMIGLIGGSFSQTAYDFIREIGGDKIKALLGSRVSRQRSANGDE